MSTETLEKLAKAHHYFALEQYSIALPRFTALINTSPNYDLYISRAATLIKLNKIDDALKDCAAAIANDSNRYEAFYQQGVCYFWQGKYDKSLEELEQAKSKLGDSDAHEFAGEQIGIWTAKAKAETTNRKTLVDSKLGPRAIPAPVEVKPVQTTPAPQKVEKPAEEKKVEEKKPEAPKVQSTSSQPSTVKPFAKIPYIWRQTDKKVYLEIKHAIQKKESLKVKIEPKIVEIAFPIDASRNFQLDLDLFDEIIPESSYFNIHLDRIEVVIEKKNSGKGWPSLENPETAKEIVLETKGPQPVQPAVIQQTPVSYPSSSKNKKDWSKIDREIEEDMKANKDEYQDEDPLNKMFKQIYQGADENTRRAMMKSFQTSGGTVLSTNWDEVAKKDYTGKDRPDAPAGQEWRKYE